MTLEDLFTHLDSPVVQNQFYAAILVSIACGIIGTYVVVKRVVFISGGISHSSFGGIGLAYYLNFEPMLGAILFAVGTAIIIGIASLRAKIREDSTIGVLWVVGMALGIIFMNNSKGAGRELEILFGNILLADILYIWYMVVLIIIILLTVILFYKEFLALSFDEEYARISGVHTGFFYIILLVLVALTVVLVIKVVGVILAIALLTIPAALAGLFTHNLKRMMIWATGIGLILSMAGIFIAWEYNLPIEETIVIVLAIVFVGAIVGKKVIHKLRQKPTEA